MTIDLNIVDGTGSKEKATVSDNALAVNTVGYPPFARQKTQVFSQPLTDDGLTTGSQDLGVDGSTTNTKFWVPAHRTDDIYINRMSIILGYGTSSPLYDFCDSGAPLTNGFQFQYTNAFGEDITVGTITKMYDILRMATASGVTPPSWEIRNLIASQDYGVIASLDLAMLVPPYGVQLLHGTNSRVQFNIRDDCQDADVFSVLALGFKRFE
jgi:hypothetical protein